MTFLRLLFLALLAICLLIVALANMGPVTLQLLPNFLAAYVGLGSVTLPKFVVILAAIAVGLLIGFTWEWLREHKHRSEAARQRAEKERLERELAKSRATTSERDEILALVESPR
ncbi:LapA family protein [Jannaschia sp. LMIT008]|uniref:LapA family protein n=1 Tax=Jannaschia maritima TaxID=3032585 RepID=UPI0028119C2C|nr:LapA family protein [Jannaschia sp. LMIT008]